MTSLDREMTVTAELRNRVLCHVTQNNPQYKEIVRQYHMDEINSITNYMLRVVGEYLHDARMLNASFHSALTDLGINWNELLLPKVTKKESTYRRAV